MRAYKHYKNMVEARATGFFTTTCLDFNHALRRPAIRDVMCMRLCDDSLYYGALLHAFAVMSNHIHIIATMPDDLDGSAFMKRLKERSAKQVLPMLNDEERHGFDGQRGLNQRKFWQVSFDSLPIESRRALLQKLEYVHNNPVEAGLCERAEGYRWSSAQFHSQGLWGPDLGLAEGARPLYRRTE